MTNVVFVNYHYPAEIPTLLIVRDRGEDIQQGGVGPALVNLDKKEISSEDIMAVVSLTAIPCNKTICWSSSLPKSERRTRSLTNMEMMNICIKYENINICHLGPTC